MVLAVRCCQPALVGEELLLELLQAAWHCQIAPAGLGRLLSLVVQLEVQELLSAVPAGLSAVPAGLSAVPAGFLPIPLHWWLATCAGLDWQ